MYSIKHLFSISSKSKTVYEALTTHQGISSWWTPTNKIEPVAGSIAEFNFGEKYKNKFKILELRENKIVHWECIEGDREWRGTKFKFILEEDSEKTIVRFSHYDWREDTDFYASCNYQWGCYMRSIKEYCETGKGTPFNPDEFQE
jgi:uncharacterized protein YndB with AHSA1/START domain